MHTFQCTTRVSKKGKCLAKPFFKTKRALILEKQEKVFHAKLILNFLILSKIYSKFFKRFFKTFQNFAQDFFKPLLPNSLQSLKMSKHMLVLRGSISVYKVLVSLKQNLFKHFFQTVISKSFRILLQEDSFPQTLKSLKFSKHMRVLRGSISKTKCSVKIMLNCSCIS